MKAENAVGRGGQAEPSAQDGQVRPHRAKGRTAAEHAATADGAPEGGGRHVGRRAAPGNKEPEILAAAEREFMSKGFDGARTTSIAEAAGVTHAMLHYYFHTKEQLFCRIIDNKLRLMGESLLMSVEGNPQQPFLRRLETGIGRHFDFMAENPDLPRFVINEILSRPERYTVMQESVRRIAAALGQTLQRELDAAAGRGETERMDIRMLMLDIVSLNAFTFISYPIIEPIFGDLTEQRERFLKMKRAENIETIMRRLRRAQTK